MSQLEFLLTFLSVIIGLGLTNLLESLHALIHPRRSVDWHWLPLAWTGFVALMVVEVWWTYFSELQSAIFNNQLVFSVVLLQSLCLYLLCAFALPESRWEFVSSSAASQEPEAPLDLEAFYFSGGHRRWFFGIGLVFAAATIVKDIVAILGMHGPEAEAGSVAFWYNLFLVHASGRGWALLLAGIYATLFRTENRRTHAVLTLVALTLMLIVSVLDVSLG